MRGIGFMPRARFGGVVSTSAAPYTWYPSLDKNAVPFHAGAGAWGTQYTIREAAAPVTTTSVTVTTWTDFRAQCLLGGRVITIGADIDGDDAAISGNCTDLDIIIPVGRVLRSFAIGQFGQGQTHSRVRIRGSTAGTYSGGQLHHLTCFGTANDFILDGIDITGPGVVAGSQQVAVKPNDGGARWALTRCKIMAGNENYIGHVDDLIVTGCSAYSGAEAAGMGGDEAWNFRQSGGHGAHIFFQNDFRGRRYHRIRIHPDGNGLDYVWVAENNFLDFDTARILTVDSGLVTSPKGYLSGFWALSNEVWSHEVSPGDDFSSHAAAYVRFTGNVFHSDNGQTSAATLVVNDVDSNLGTSPIPDGDENWDKTGNTFGGLTDYPAGPAWKTTTPGSPMALNWNIGS